MNFRITVHEKGLDHFTAAVAKQVSMPEGLITEGGIPDTYDYDGYHYKVMWTFFGVSEEQALLEASDWLKKIKTELANGIDIEF
jgi:hypothetical protein